MRKQTQNGVKLPRQLLNELESKGGSFHVASTPGKTPGARKELRKASRVDKKRTALKSLRLRKKSQPRKLEERKVGSLHDSLHGELQLHGVGREQGQKSILKKPTKPDEEFSEDEESDASNGGSKRDGESGSASEASQGYTAPIKAVSRTIQNKLAQDNAEIEALEKALGIRNKKGPSKPLEDDGLDDILGDLADDEKTEALDGAKRQRIESAEWLKNKRLKAANPNPGGFTRLARFEASKDEETGSEEYFSASNDESGSGDASEAESSEEFYEDSKTSKISPRKVRENPYVAPAGYAMPSTKYIPPSLRAPSSKGEGESLQRLRRQAKGLLNRLSEANLLSILSEIETLYQTNPRQHVNLILLDLLMALLCDPSALQETFIILHGGFITAIFKVIGADFGAQVIQRILEDFDSRTSAQNNYSDNGQKTLSNLVALVAELYNFQLVGSGLVYDFIRMFVKDISETNTELLLKIIRHSGPQLRQDDPSALKDVVVLMQAAVSKAGEGNLTVRTKFMIETINSLKNNRMKTGIAASTIASEHTIRMKKILGSLNNRNLKGSEPLRITIKDIRECDKRGKWWLVGASYKDENETNEKPQSRLSAGIGQSADSNGLSLLQLAKEQRMNTDVRRSIFVSIMSATDYKDAHRRLIKLGLKRAQELEIPKVLLHCASAEEQYNPYYTLIARELCADRKLKMAFQFSLWDMFKLMGEDTTEENYDDEDDQGPSTRAIVNLAKMYGILILNNRVGLSLLKNLNLVYLQPRTSIFVELLLITILVESQSGEKTSQSEETIMGIFLKLRDTPGLIQGFQFFVKKVLKKTDVAGSNEDLQRVRRGCRIIEDTLKALASTKLVQS